MAFIIGILGNLVAELFSSTGKFLFSDLTNKPEWKAWKAEHHLSPNDSDFLDRYGEALVLMKQAGKSEPLLKFFTEKAVVELIHTYWYGNLETENFETQSNQLARWFTLDKRLSNFSVSKEVFFFLEKIKQAANENRTAGETEDHQTLARIEILLEGLTNQGKFEYTDLNGKLLIYCHTDDRHWIESELVGKLKSGGIEIYLDDRDYRMGDYGLLSEKLLTARLSLIVFSKNFNKSQKRLLSGFMDEYGSKKLCPLRFDTNEVFEGFENFIDLSGTPDATWNDLVRRLTNEFGVASAALPYPPLAPEHVNIEALPHRGASDHLFGRQVNLKLLDETWDNEEINVISFVADGGVGKSALISRWVSDMAKDNYRGANRVLATSFYSQGSTDRIASSDLWMNEALHWFGEKEYDTRSPWDKGKRLAQLVNEHRTLLLLDGLEPMQEGGQIGRGTVKDPALATLIRQLAKRNNGLLVITTREALGGFERFEKNMRSQNLETISDEAGKHILRFAGRRGIQGSDNELVAAVHEFGNHAFAINLLGSYIYCLPSHPISAAFEIPDLSDIPVEKGKHPRRIIAVLADKLKKDGKIGALNILKYLGFFDRPVPQSIFEVLDEKLIDPIAPLHELRKRKIIYDELIHAPNMVDCHPLVREHFMDILEKNFPEVWQKGNEKLFRYYEALPEQLYGKYLPDTLEEMEPLFRAVMHGCRAMLHQPALNEVYWTRIKRREEHYSTKKLGAFDSDLTTLAWFFKHTWDRPEKNLTEHWRAVLLSWVGFRLRALGLLKEAEQPMINAIKLQKGRENWAETALNTSNLSELNLTSGDLQKAVAYGEESVRYADRHGRVYQREVNRTTYAYALHQTNKKKIAATLFAEAEQMLQDRQPKFKYLYSMQGFRYCELLFDIGKFNDVLKRAKTTLEWALSGNYLLAIALDYLSIGKAYLYLCQTNLIVSENYENARHHLDQAVMRLQKAGDQNMFPLALLARAAYHRITKNYPAALEDLGEVLDIAEPSGMRLHVTDYHLEMARLCLAMSEEQPEKIAEAKEHMELAAQLVEDTGYHRRDGEVAELREKLREK